MKKLTKIFMLFALVFVGIFSVSTKVNAAFSTAGNTYTYEENGELKYIFRFNAENTQVVIESKSNGNAVYSVTPGGWSYTFTKISGSFDVTMRFDPFGGYFYIDGWNQAKIAEDPNVSFGGTTGGTTNPEPVEPTPDPVEPTPDTVTKEITVMDGSYYLCINKDGVIKTFNNNGFVTENEIKAVTNLSYVVEKDGATVKSYWTFKLEGYSKFSSTDLEIIMYNGNSFFFSDGDKYYTYFKESMFFSSTSDKDTAKGYLNSGDLPYFIMDEFGSVFDFNRATTLSANVSQTSNSILFVGKVDTNKLDGVKFELENVNATLSLFKSDDKVNFVEANEKINLYTCYASAASVSSEFVEEEGVYYFIFKLEVDEWLESSFAASLSIKVNNIEVTAASSAAVALTNGGN